MKRRTLLAAAASGPWLAPARAQAYPAKPIRLLIGYAAAGLIDLMMRAISETLRKELGVNVIVDNKPGASGSIAAAALKQSPADGYTLMHAEASVLYINEHVGTVAYDPARDFTYIGTIGRSSFGLVVNARLPVNTFEEFVAMAKANPGKINYGTPGASSPHRIAMEQLQQETGISLTHVAYKGGAPALTDVRSGHIEAMLTDLSVSMPYLREGSLRALGVCTPSRLAVVPAVPTFAELGIGDVPAYVLHGLVGPAGLPPAMVTRLNAALQASVRTADLGRFVETGFVPTLGTPQQFETFVSGQRKRVGEMVRRLGITAG